MTEQNNAAGTIESAVKASREKRLSTSNIAPSAANGFTGSVTATIAETSEQVVFSFVTPELGERDARAIVAGYAARLSIAASGKKTPEDILIALQSEIKILNGGTYTMRGGGSSVQSSFTDTIISLGLLRKYPVDLFPEVAGCKFSEEQYNNVLNDNALLVSIQAKWDAADEAGKKALITADVTKTKRLVGFYKL